MEKPKFFENFDWPLVLTTFFILIIGLISVYSASISYQFENNFFGKQLLLVGLGIVLMLLFSILDFKFFLKYSYIFYIITIFLLVYAYYNGFGSKSSNVSRWINLFGITIQPSELAKIVVILSLAQYFRSEKKIGNSALLVVPILILIVPFVLIFLQPDLGTSIILAITVAIIIFLTGVYWKWIITSFIFLILSIPLIWVYIFKDYQKERISILFDPQKDPLGAGYHIIQSKIAIGSGAFWGKGFLQGQQAQLNFLPARHTDFIFSVLSEEWGFLGAFIVVLSYFFLTFCILKNINKYQSRSAIVLTLGITGTISTQAFINIAMVTGLLPVVGLPLPLMSYGGSSMITSLVSIGMLLNIKRQEQAGIA
jgi:rod shape determining protein RodA